MSTNELMENETEQESVSFEVEDDTPQSVAVETSVVGDSEEKTSTNVREEENSEVENYSENVQKRINQLTAKRKQAIEEAEAAYTYAQQVQQQNEEMKGRIAQLDQGYIAEYGGRVESQDAAAKKMLKEAYDSGNVDAMADAQGLIANLAIEKERIRVQKNRQERQSAQAQQPVQQQQPQVQQPRQAQELDPKLKNWMGDNSWFGRDKFMTRGAESIHEQLVAEEGYDPNSDDYYAEIDRRMRREMPNKFQGKQKNAQTVSPASNGRSSTKSGRKKTVELTPGQVAFATKMKIPLERYAQEVAKLERKVK